MALTALQGGGSPQHAEQYCRMRAARTGQGNGDQLTPGAGGPAVVVNLLVPRPEYPQGSLSAAPTLRLPPPDLPTRPMGNPR
jgi:hypothetical protein